VHESPGEGASALATGPPTSLVTTKAAAKSADTTYRSLRMMDIPSAANADCN
jgi:hypothetical protein